MKALEFTDFLSRNVYIVSAALLLIGMALKQTPHLPHWSIPYILSVIGIVACNLSLGGSIDATLQGVIVAGVSVYAHQLGKQGMELVRCSKKSPDGASAQNPAQDGAAKQDGAAGPADAADAQTVQAQSQAAQQQEQQKGQ